MSIALCPDCGGRVERYGGSANSDDFLYPIPTSYGYEECISCGKMWAADDPESPYNELFGGTCWHLEDEEDIEDDEDNEDEDTDDDMIE